MGCNCNRQKDLTIIKRLATVYTKITKQAVQIYYYETNNEKFYNFELVNNNRNNIIEIIKP